MMRRAVLFWMAVSLAIMAIMGPAAFAQSGHAAASKANVATAVFAGGCFWCMEETFDAVEGVLETTSGYTGGKVKNPSYEQVSAGGTGHREALRVRYDANRISYPQLLDIFWRNVDPLDGGGQFCDRGTSYLSAIFVADDAQKQAALASKQKVAAQFKKIATTIEPLGAFYVAEGYHQDYHNKNPLQYKIYKWNCGRAQRLQQVWGPSSAY